MLQKCAFPYKTCDPSSNPLDALLLQDLKHDACHVNLDVCGCTERQFVIRQPKRTALSYTIQVNSWVKSNSIYLDENDFNSDIGIVS